VIMITVFPSIALMPRSAWSQGVRGLLKGTGRFVATYTPIFSFFL